MKTIGDVLFVILFVAAIVLWFLPPYLYFAAGKFKTFFHDTLNWHEPDKDGEFWNEKGIVYTYCKYCGKKITRDLHDNWVSCFATQDKQDTKIIKGGKIKMSRCGGCDLYWPDGKNNFGITCSGNCSIEECAQNLQSLIGMLRDAMDKDSPRTDTSPITSFRGDFKFLSNFAITPFVYDGQPYTNAEAAFQAQKILDLKKREKFSFYDPKTAKRMGRTGSLRHDWEDVKLDIMENILYAKFTSNDTLRLQLLSTGNRLIIEGNTWGDIFWGVCNGVGENHLGKLLIRVRDRIRNEYADVVSAEFTSVWDGGFEVTTPCKVNLKTKEVFDIEESKGTADSVNELDEEYITINGQDYSVVKQEDLDENPDSFWYQ